MTWTWHALLICLVVVPVSVLWVVAVVDLVVRRDDLRPWVRFGWLLAVLVLPVVGALAYACVAVERSPVAAGTSGRL